MELSSLENQIQKNFHHPIKFNNTNITNLKYTNITNIKSLHQKHLGIVLE